MLRGWVRVPSVSLRGVLGMMARTSALPGSLWRSLVIALGLGPRDRRPESSRADSHCVVSSRWQSGWPPTSRPPVRFRHGALPAP